MAFQPLTYQGISDQNISDCVASLLGLYLTYSGSDGAALFMKWIGFEFHVKSICKNSQSTSKAFASKSQGYLTIEKAIGYEFTDIAYLDEAFTHKTCADHSNHSYERYRKT